MHTTERTGMSASKMPNGRTLSITSAPAMALFLTTPLKYKEYVSPELLINFKKLPLRNIPGRSAVNTK